MLQDQLNDYSDLIATLSLDDCQQDSSDLSILTYMAYIVSSVAEEVAHQPKPLYPFFTYREEPFYAFHRLIIYNRPLPAGQDLHFVGFISQRRPEVAGETLQKLDETDKILVQELARQGDLLTYSSLQLHDGNWVNLVQFARPSGKENLLATKTHQQAAYHLAPSYYRWIRLHHGLIPQGDLLHGLQLHLTKYYTFHSPALRPDIRVHHYLPLATVGNGNGNI